jgi:hypothetical protein
MAGGRPTTYSKTILKKARAYLAECQDDEELDDFDDPEEQLELQGHGGALRRRRKPEIVVTIPTIGGLARYLKVARSTLYVWAKEHPEFSDVMEALGAEQEDRLIRNGLGGTYNPTIAKVLLTKHGYREGIENTGEGGGPLKHTVDITEQLEKTYGSTSAVPGDGTAGGVA